MLDTPVLGLLARGNKQRFQIGDRVTGHDCAGAGFEGKVTGIPGPHSLLVDGVFTPISLIEAAPAPQPPDSASAPTQGDLFG